MQKTTVPTNLHCQGCVEKITPIFDNDQDVTKWDVRVVGQSRLLTAEGHKIDEQKIQSLLKEAGYDLANPSGFWNDVSQWKRASFNTLNCLIGCSIGDFGMIFFLQVYYPSTPMIWQMIAAIITGLCTSILLEAIILKNREKFSWSSALKTALGMSFISMVAMELAMTGTDFMITGGKAAFEDPLYWLALIPALLVGFFTPLPYNYYKLKKYNQACH